MPQREYKFLYLRSGGISSSIINFHKRFNKLLKQPPLFIFLMIFHPFGFLNGTGLDFPERLICYDRKQGSSDMTGDKNYFCIVKVPEPT